MGEYSPPGAGRIRAGIGGRLLRTRWLMSAPVWLWRVRLGCLLGSRLLLLEHAGRHTGARRFAVLEVLDRRPGDTYVVASGFGERAQWYRNILAEPRVRCRSPGGCRARARPGH